MIAFARNFEAILENNGNSAYPCMILGFKWNGFGVFIYGNN